MRTLRPLLAGALALALVAQLAPTAAATLVRGFSLHELVRAGHSAVRGEVIGAEVVWDAAWGNVYTHTFVRVDEVLSGAERVGDVVVVRQLGGLLDGVEQRVVGTADLPLGAEVVVFARSDGAFHYLVGMAQGAWRVTRAGAGATACG